MKRLWSVVLAAVMLAAVAGCARTPTGETGSTTAGTAAPTAPTEPTAVGETLPPMTAVTAAHLRAVLLGQETCVEVSETGTPGRTCLVDELYRWEDDEIPPRQFCVVDLDGDGDSEAVVTFGSSVCQVVFHAVGDTVYAYKFNYREMRGFKTDGSFSWSGSGMISGVSGLRFEGTRAVVYGKFSLDVSDPEDMKFYEGEYETGTPITEAAHERLAVAWGALPDAEEFAFAAEEIAARVG